MSGDPFELDVQEQRRRVLWQRVYLQALDRLMAQPPISVAVARSYAIAAGDHASEAVRQLDEWERRQEAPPRPAAPDRGGADDTDDDPDAQYLGR